MINWLRSRLFRLYKNLEIRQHTLLYLFLEITRKCNLNCLHCGSDCKSEENTSSLAVTDWLEIIHYVHRNFGKQVAFIITGGEPLLHPGLEKIGAAIAKLGMRWSLVSNGLQLSEQKFRNLRNAGLYSLTISLDGDESAHNYLRCNKTAFAKAVAAIAIVANGGLELCDVVTCVYPANLEKLDTIAKILLDKKIPAWRLFRIFPAGRAVQNSELLLNHQQTWQMLNWIAKNRPYYKKKGLKVSASCEGFVPFAMDLKIRDIPFFCRAGVNFASILCDGSITGCSNNHPSFYQGNILKDDFLEIWQNGFADMRTREWVKNTSCATCRYFKDCQGGSIHLWDKDNKYPNFCYMH